MRPGLNSQVAAERLLLEQMRVLEAEREASLTIVRACSDRSARLMARLKNLERYRCSAVPMGTGASTDASQFGSASQPRGPAVWRGSGFTTPDPTSSGATAGRPPAQASARDSGGRAALRGDGDWRPGSGGATNGARDPQEAQTLRLVSRALERNAARGRNNLALAEKLQAYIGLLQRELRRVRLGDAELAARILQEHAAKTTAPAAAAPPPMPSPPPSAAPASGGGAGDATAAPAASSGPSPPPLPPPQQPMHASRPTAAPQDAVRAGGGGTPFGTETGARSGAERAGLDSMERSRGDPPDRLDGGTDIRRVFSRSALVELPGDLAPGQCDGRGGSHADSRSCTGGDESTGSGGAGDGGESGNGGGGAQADPPAMAPGGPAGEAPATPRDTAAEDSEPGTLPAGSRASPAGPASGTSQSGPQQQRNPAPQAASRPGFVGGAEGSSISAPDTGPSRGMSLEAARALAQEAENARAALMGLLSPQGALPGPLQAGATLGGLGGGGGGQGGEAEGRGAAQEGAESVVDGEEAGSGAAAVYALAGSEVPERTTVVGARGARVATGGVSSVAPAGGAKGMPRDETGRRGSDGSAGDGEGVRALAVLLYGVVSELRRRRYVGCEDLVEVAMAAVEKELEAVRAMGAMS